MRNPGIQKENDYSAWPDTLSDDDGLLRPAPGRLDLVVEEGAGGARLDKWLAMQLPQFSRTRLKAWIEAGAVLVDGDIAAARQAVWSRQKITVDPQRSPSESAAEPEAIPLAIVFEDDDLLVINKAAGLVVHPAAGNWQGTLLNGLLHYRAEQRDLPRAGIVHRLDKDTSGLMVVAKTVEAQLALVRQLQARTVKRQYLALVHGAPGLSGVIDRPIGRHLRERTKMAVFKSETPSTKAAITHYEVLQQVAAERGIHGAAALLCCSLETGRTHQIRVHLESEGFSIVGDPVYRGRRLPDAFGRQALHAWRLALIHPRLGTPMQWSIAPPNDFQELLVTWGFRLATL